MMAGQAHVRHSRRVRELKKSILASSKPFQEPARSSNNNNTNNNNKIIILVVIIGIIIVTTKIVRMMLFRSLCESKCMCKCTPGVCTHSRSAEECAHEIAGLQVQRLGSWLFCSGWHMFSLASSVLLVVSVCASRFSAPEVLLSLSGMDP